VAARALQAAGAAAQLPTSLALLPASVPAEHRTRATRNWAAGPAQRQDFRAAWLLAAALSVVAAAVGVRIIRTATRPREGAAPAPAPATP